MSITLTKGSFCILTLAILLISNTEASCWRYGHSCWGGHGKRSGGGSRGPMVDVQRITDHNSSPSDRLAAQFQELSNLQEQADILEKNSREFTNVLEDTRGRNDIQEEISRGEKDEDLPQIEISDYDQPIDASLLPVVAHSRKTGGIDAEVALALDRSESYESVRNSLEESSELKRGVGDASRRRSPSDKLLLYKLVRVLRRK